MSWKQLGVVCLTFAVAAPSAAQQGRRHQQAAKTPTQLLRLKMTLEFSADQVAQLEALQTQFAEQRTARRAESRDLREQARSGDVTARST